MTKHRTKTRMSLEEEPKTVAVELPLPLLAVRTTSDTPHGSMPPPSGSANR